jgi:hypothetical protein
MPVVTLLARRAWPVPAAVLLGVVIGVLVSLTGSTSRRAEAAVLISSPRGPAAVTPYLPNLRELAMSGVLAGNVHSTLRLEESVENVRRHLHASVRPRSQVIVVAATDPSADTARQLAQEAALVFTRLVASRFGSRTPPLQAALFDSAHVLPGPNRHFLRNTLIGAGAGLFLGALAALLLAGGLWQVRAAVSAAAVNDPRWPQSTLEQRLKSVAKRERELARRAGQVGAHERDLAKRERELEKNAVRAGARRQELDARQRALDESPVVPPEPEAAAQPPPGPTPAVEPVGRGGGWNVNDLQRVVGARTDATPEQAEEWRTYLFFLREHADSAGLLPATFDALVSDVFGPLLP